MVNTQVKASVMFLPIIDLDPGNTSCIYSTLHFVTAQAKRYDVTPVMTFNQPLYWKAMMIIRSQPDDSDLKCMVLGFGGFNIQMSFLCSIGHLMADSGLHKLFEIAYTSNTVSHRLTGKAVSRADRGHLLVYTARNTILVADTYNVPVPTKQEADDSEAIGVLQNPERSDDDDETHDLDTDTITTDLTAAAELHDRAMSCTFSVCWSLTSLCHSNGHIETMPAREINPFTFYDQDSIPVSQDTVIDEQSSASEHDCASDRSTIGAGMNILCERGVFIRSVFIRSVSATPQ